MSIQESIKDFSKFYKNTPFSDNEIEKMSKKVLHFGKVFILSLKLIKREWQRVYLKLFLFVFLAGLFSIFVSIVISLTFLIANRNFYENQLFSPIHIIYPITLFLVFIIYYFIVTNIFMKTVYTLNNQLIKNTFKAYISLKKFIHFFTISIFLLVVAGLISINFVSIYFFISSWVNTIMQILTVCIIIYVINPIYMSILEDKLIIKSVIESWQLTKKYFWKDLSRKICFLIFIIPTVVTTSILFYISHSTVISIFAESKNLLINALPYLFFIYIVFYIIFNFILIFTMTFNYISFINLRLLTTKNQPKINHNNKSNKTLLR